RAASRPPATRATGAPAPRRLRCPSPGPAAPPRAASPTPPRGTSHGTPPRPTPRRPRAPWTPPAAHPWPRSSTPPPPTPARPGPADFELVHPLEVPGDGAAGAVDLECIARVGADHHAAQLERPLETALELDQCSRPVLVVDIAELGCVLDDAEMRARSQIDPR